MNFNLALLELSKLMQYNNYNSSDDINIISDRIKSSLCNSNVAYEYVSDESVAKEIVMRFIDEYYYASYTYLYSLKKYEITISRMKTISMRLSCK